MNARCSTFGVFLSFLHGKKLFRKNKANEKPWNVCAKTEKWINRSFWLCTRAERNERKHIHCPFSCSASFVSFSFSLYHAFVFSKSWVSQPVYLYYCCFLVFSPFCFDFASVRLAGYLPRVFTFVSYFNLLFRVLVFCWCVYFLVWGCQQNHYMPMMGKSRRDKEKLW